MATLNDATGPNSKVTGVRAAAGASQLVLASAFTPPNRAHSALVRSGLCPCNTAQGSHSNHHTCCTGSPQLQVIECAGSPPNQTWAHSTNDRPRYKATAEMCAETGVLVEGDAPSVIELSPTTGTSAPAGVSTPASVMRPQFVRRK